MQKSVKHAGTVDMKKQITIGCSQFAHCYEEELEDGRIILEPRVLVSPFEISKNTLSMMDSSVENLKQGRVSKPVDLSSFSPE